jgi:CBS domain-containing protein
MKVKKPMHRQVGSCTPETDLAAAAMIMWRNDCGIVPVVTPGTGKAIGVITDRDICMAVGTRHLRPEEIRVGEVMSGRLIAVHADDDVKLALESMRTEKVRRLPVVNRDDALEGMLSINDIVLAVETPVGLMRQEPAATDVIMTLKSICEHRPLEKPAPAEEPVAV